MLHDITMKNRIQPTIFWRLIHQRFGILPSDDGIVLWYGILLGSHQVSCGDLYNWRFPKMGVPPNHPKLDYYDGIETYGFGDPPF